MNINYENLTTDALNTIIAQAKAELAKRSCNNELILFTHKCKDSSNHHLNKYKHWAKLVSSVDTTKTNGYAFNGTFLNVNAEHKLPAGSIVVEVCDKNIACYKLDKTGKVKLYSGTTTSMSSFIADVAQLFW